jgi:hypothetical protein
MLNHDYVEVQSVTATCITEGKVVSACQKCGDIVETIVPKTDHVWKFNEQKKEATCEETGLVVEKCAICENERTTETTTLGHNWSSERVTDVDSTCYEFGESSIHCTRCDARTSIKIVEKKEHDLGSWEIVENATCTKEGLEQRGCKNCDYSEQRSTEALGHDWTAWQTKKAATCTEEGLEDIECSRCDAVREERAIAKIAHDFGEWQVVKEPTCTEDGAEKRKCKNCIEEESRGVLATGHVWGDYTVDVAAKCLVAGSKSIYCTVCGVKQDGSTTTIPALGHDYSSVWTLFDENSSCLGGGYEARHCSRCDATIGKQEIDPLGHVDENGDGVCDRCGEDAGN